MNHARRLLLSALAGLALLAGAPGAFAADTGMALGRDASTRLALVFTNAIMMVFDESEMIYRERAREQMLAAEGPVKAVVAELAQRDPTASSTIAEAWRVAYGSLLGGGEFGPGMMKTGYDAKVHADFDDNMQRMMREIQRAYGLREPSAPVEVRAHVLAARTVAAYVKIAGSPFGAYTDSYNTDEEDLEAQVAGVDKVLAELEKKYRKDADMSAKFRRLNAKWQFIRATILKANTQSTPFIVYLHGGDVVRGLAEFR